MYVGECFADGVWKPCLRVGIVENGARLRVYSFKYDEKKLLIPKGQEGREI